MLSLYCLHIYGPFDILVMPRNRYISPYFHVFDNLFSPSHRPLFFDMAYLDPLKQAGNIWICILQFLWDCNPDLYCVPRNRKLYHSYPCQSFYPCVLTFFHPKLFSKEIKPTTMKFLQLVRSIKSRSSRGSSKR